MEKKSRNESRSISTIISLSLVLFIIGLLLFVIIWTPKVSDQIKESLSLSIFLKNNESDNINDEQQRQEFYHYLKNSKYFKDIIFIHKDTATKELEKILDEEFSKILGSSPLLHSFDANITADFVSAKGMEEVKSYIYNFSGGEIVQEIIYQENIVAKLEENIKKISLFLIISSIALFLISLTLINNTIRLSIYSKRLLIRTMRLVGATNLFIQKPYLKHSAYQGFFSSIIAILLLIGTLETLEKQIPDFIQSNDFINIGIIFMLIIIFGIIISCTSTFFAMRRYLNLNENELYN